MSSNIDATCQHSVVVLAHQGGWDELLFVAVPLVVLTVVLLIAKRRAEREAREELERPK